MSASDAVDGSFAGHGSAIDVGAVEAHDSQQAKMQAITTIGLDITKLVFQVHGIDAASNVLSASS